jgi:hypothetical protein
MIKDILVIVNSVESIFSKYKTLLIIVATFLVIITVIRQCEKEPKVVTKTVTKVVTKHDTINEVIIKEVPKTVYINKYITKEGETKIVYVKEKDSSTIEAKQYDTKLKSNDAEADLKVTVDGTLLDIQGIITYPEKTITKTITKYKNKSGLFLYGNVGTNPKNVIFEVGLSYQFKNTLMINSGVTYNDFTKSANLMVGVGVKIF